ncbi:molybdopterin converting factor subunit 1 [Pseudohongiella spirulinae]|uniref:Sulfur carrier protein MoaD n=1 Tax=Pseudohongiella spirulinae TaxID=1249552 RepID=A0A0S2KD37_9GAMM|nr:molybdopterin converting factor subunit 1 [Pseudohongiella spirulinae]ALO46219.1 Sulfur carrier protein MoaD [Pseudohongiella spirulinae]
MLTIQYFASVREQLGRAGEEMALPDGAETVADLIDVLQSRGAPWSLLSDQQQVLVAVDQAVADRGHRLAGNEEIAFFPPMTGG